MRGRRVTLSPDAMRRAARSRGSRAAAPGAPCRMRATRGCMLRGRGLKQCVCVDGSMPRDGVTENAGYARDHQRTVNLSNLGRDHLLVFLVAVFECFVWVLVLDGVVLIGCCCI